jgi:hypothetical protein
MAFTQNISYPRQAYKDGMQGIVSTYGNTKIASGDATVTVTCGWLKGDSIVRIMQSTVGSSSAQMQLIEAKYDGSGTLQRKTGPAGQFVVSTVDGSTVPGDVYFDWVVLEA